jgi:hypothetical protein
VTAVLPDVAVPSSVATAAARLRVMANLIEAYELRSSDTWVSVDLDTIEDLQRWAAALGITEVTVTQGRTGNMVASLRPCEAGSPAYVSCRFKSDRCPVPAHAEVCTCGRVAEASDAQGASC